MGRLIDADELKKYLKKYLHYGHAIPWVDAQPTAYDPDKVVEQLENERKFWENAYDSNLGKEKARSYEHAIEIMKGGGIDG
jgi:hypothetical protein